MKPRRLIATLVVSLALLAPMGPAQAWAPTPAALSIQADTAFRGQVGLQFLATFRPSGGTAPYQWSATGLPPGLWMDSSGALRGIPVSAQRWSTTIRLTDATGASASTTVSITVAARQGRLTPVSWPTFPGKAQVEAVTSDAQWALLLTGITSQTEPDHFVIYNLRTRTITKRLTALDSMSTEQARRISWSPDGRYLVFTTSQGWKGLPSAPRIWRYDRVEDRLQTLLEYDNSSWYMGAKPVLSGNNRYLFYRAITPDCGYHLCVYRLDLTTRQRLLVWGQTWTYNAGWILPGQVSTDGRWVVAVVHSAAFGPVEGRGEYPTVIKDLTTGVVRTILRHSEHMPELTISGDGSTVALGHQGKAYLWQADTGKLQAISRMPDGSTPPTVADYSVRLSTDGQVVEFLATGGFFSTPGPVSSNHLYRYTRASHS